MVRKLIILGIDGMDWDVIVRYKDKLPNLYGLMQKNNYPHLRSVFPADTTPAWSTIYTGLDPSEHGIINFVNVGAKENTYKPLVFDDSAFKGKAFWDVLNKQGLSANEHQGRLGNQRLDDYSSLRGKDSCLSAEQGEYL